MTVFWEPLWANIAFASAVWLLSLFRSNASIIDVCWSLMFISALVLWFPPNGAVAQQWLVASLVACWGFRLALHLAWRNWGKPEDRRYRAMRQRNSPGFWWKSYFLVFLLQAALAWLASWSLYGALRVQGNGLLLVAGVVVCIAGFLFEAVADWQLARFSRLSASKDTVLDQGLWRYSRHPNYFGECCFWWGVYLVALEAGYWWTLVSPLLMTWLLLRVSGVSLLEQDMAQRRPAYEVYQQRTPAFVPGRPRLLVEERT